MATASNVTKFTSNATENRTYQIRLVDPNKNNDFHHVRVERHGEIIILNGELNFFVNPDSLTKTWPARTTITQTPHSSWVDSFGAGLPQWSLRGQTGWRARTHPGIIGPSSVFDGYLAYHSLHDFIVEYYEENRRRVIRAATDGTSEKLLELHWHDFYDDDIWVIEPAGIPQKIRSASHSHTIHYEWQFTGITNLKAKRSNTFVTPDALAAALVGNQERTNSLAESLNASVADTVANIQACHTMEREDAGGASEANKTFAKAMGIQGEESSQSIQARGSLGATGGDMGSLAAAAKSAGAGVGTLSNTFGSAIEGAIASGRQLVQSSMVEGLAAIGSVTNQAQASFSSLFDAPTLTAGDAAAAATLSPDALTSATVTMGGASNDLDTSSLGSAVESGSSISNTAASVLGPIKKLGTELGEVASGVRDSLDGGIEAAKGAVASVKKVVGALGSAMDNLRVFSNSWRLLSQLRRSMSQTMCAAQSILAFPYFFRRDLMRGMQGVLDLFKLSGCATSFPDIPGLSWNPSIPLPKLIT